MDSNFFSFQDKLIQWKSGCIHRGQLYK